MTPVFPAPAICWMLNLSMNNSRSLILGVGNPLRRDDGFGPEVIRCLLDATGKKEVPAFPNTTTAKINDDSVDMIDGGTDGLGLLEYIKNYKKVFLIDAVEMGTVPGTIKVFTPGDALFHIHNDSLSTHGFGIAELIKLAQGLDILPDLTVIGIQPQDTGYGKGLSKTVQSGVERTMATLSSLLVVEQS